MPPSEVAHLTRETIEEIRHIAASYPDMKVTTPLVPGVKYLPWHVDSTIRLHKSDDKEPGQFTHHVLKNRFPKSFPDKLTYDSGFGSGVTKEWLLENDPAYSRPTFGELTRNSMGWFGAPGRLVELQDRPVPGTMVIEHGVHRADLEGRMGLVVAAQAIGTLQVIWSPWRFHDGS